MAKASPRYKWSWDSVKRTATRTYTDGTVQTFPFDDLPESVRTDFVPFHFTKQVINDSHSGADDLSEIRRIAADKWNALVSGVTDKRGGIASVDWTELVGAVASVMFAGDIDKATESLSDCRPTESDDADAAKRKAKKRAEIAAIGSVAAALDAARGVDANQRLSALLGIPSDDDADEPDDAA